jgi:hypothetical protein
MGCVLVFLYRMLHRDFVETPFPRTRVKNGKKRARAGSAPTPYKQTSSMGCWAGRRLK